LQCKLIARGQLFGKHKEGNRRVRQFLREGRYSREEISQFQFFTVGKNRLSGLFQPAAADDIKVLIGRRLHAIRGLGGRRPRRNDGCRRCNKVRRRNTIVPAGKKMREKFQGCDYGHDECALFSVLPPWRKPRNFRQLRKAWPDPTLCRQVSAHSPEQRPQLIKEPGPRIGPGTARC
jgi:hypothetical protein